MPAAWDEFVNAGLKAGIEPLIILDCGNRLYDNGDKPRSPEAIEAFCRFAEFVVGISRAASVRHRVDNVVHAEANRQV
jgi:hypothetical protein